MRKQLDLCNPSTLRAVARRVGLQAKGRLSQNFLIDRNVLETIVAALAPDGGDTVVEVGPGIGSLTGELAELAARVIAVDIDPACVAATRITQRHRANVTVVEADAMTVTPASLGLGPAEDAPWLAAGNLPYHLTGALLSRIYEFDNPPRRGVFLVQREVAARLVAGEGDWSLATVALRSIADIERIADVPPQAFDPAPRVHSSVIRMLPHRRLEADERILVLKLARLAFQMRRKTLRHGIAHALGGDKVVATATLSESGIDPGRRPGTLDLDEWRYLARISARLMKLRRPTQ